MFRVSMRMTGSLRNVYVCLAAIIAVPVSIYAQRITETDDPAIVYSRDKATIVIQMDRQFGELAESKSAPLLRIYGDGRVRVHFPRYMKRAGDYELHLSEKEMSSLLLSMARKGVMEFDAKAVKEQKAAAKLQKSQEARATGQPLLTEIFDETVTRIELKLDSYRPAGAKGRVRSNFKQKISQSELQSGASRYPAIKSLKDLAAAERLLLVLCDSDDLKKIP